MPKPSDRVLDLSAQTPIDIPPPGELRFNGVRYIRDVGTPPEVQPDAKPDAPAKDLAEEFVREGSFCDCFDVVVGSEDDAVVLHPLQTAKGRSGDEAVMNIRRCIRHAIREAVRRAKVEPGCRADEDVPWTPETELEIVRELEKFEKRILAQVKG